MTVNDSVTVFGKNGPEKAKLAAAFLDKDCDGAREPADDEIAKLKAIRDSAAPAPPQALKP